MDLLAALALPVCVAKFFVLRDNESMQNGGGNIGVLPNLSQKTLAFSQLIGQYCYLKFIYP
jgi:hypothetical protein